MSMELTSSHHVEVERARFYRNLMERRRRIGTGSIASAANKRQRRRLPTVAWGGLLLIASLCTTIPLIHRANRSLHVGKNPYHESTASAKWAFGGNIGPRNVPQELEIVSTKVPPSTVPYDDDTIPKGVLSSEQGYFFRAIQRSIDHSDLSERCRRYGFSMSQPGRPQSSADPVPAQRRIFFGSLIAEEPWELLEIVAAETYGIFEAMIFVEGNRTQSATPRPFKRTEKHIQKFQNLFGVQNIQIRRYVNEDITLEKMAREHRQRQEILKGWRDFGMGPEDIGYIADADETFTRDFLRAVQTCPYVEALDYGTHHCFNPKVKIAGYTRMFESSPECIAKRTWYHPDMIMGACVELIGNETLNPPAPRVKDYLRAPGYAHNCETRNDRMYKNSFGKIGGNHYPLWSAADFRRQCGGHNYELNATNHTKYTAYHFHNFFPDLKATRRKYSTYGHSVHGAERKRLENIGDDLKMMVRCVQNWTDAPTSKENNWHVTETQQWQREVGGLEATLKPWPIYFLDVDYRRRKHHSIQESVKWDERRRQAGMRMMASERKMERVTEEAKELKRQAWAKEAQAEALKAEIVAAAIAANMTNQNMSAPVAI
ncbi:expressed unknown protein [Seminavis robusta]|uniref:Uncharacterized protein n=1 Tax=Seminavis robusta TaxID=568900 RepID=A0A9N8EP09_9STRA|nr:expressed unknown protein [Seminavis robusta]|eukprot:Sro1561_g282580.1 n/a (601) ;mRNA; r:6197-8073